MKKKKKLPVPEHLSKKSKKIWEEYAGKVIKSSGALAMLETGLDALDRSEQARKVIEKEGMITTSERSGVTHVHPCINIEKDSRATSLKIFRALGIEKDFLWENQDLD